MKREASYFQEYIWAELRNLHEEDSSWLKTDVANDFFAPNYSA